MKIQREWQKPVLLWATHGRQSSGFHSRHSPHAIFPRPNRGATFQYTWGPTGFPFALACPQHSWLYGFSSYFWRTFCRSDWASCCAQSIIITMGFNNHWMILKGVQWIDLHNRRHSFLRFSCKRNTSKHFWENKNFVTDKLLRTFFIWSCLDCWWSIPRNMIFNQEPLDIFNRQTSRCWPTLTLTKCSPPKSSYLRDMTKIGRTHTHSNMEKIGYTKNNPVWERSQ